MKKLVNRNKNIRLVVFMFTLVFLLQVILSTIANVGPRRNVYADGLSPQDSLLLKVLKSGFKKCIESGVLSKNQINNSNFDDKSIFNTTLPVYENDKSILLPFKYGAGNTIDDGDISCEQLFVGYNSDKGAVNRFNTFGSLGGHNRPPDVKSNRATEDKNTFLEGLGYTSDNRNNTQLYCAALNYTLTDKNNVGTTRTTNSVCVNTVDGKITPSQGKKITVNDVVVKNTVKDKYISLTFNSSSKKIIVNLDLSSASKEDCSYIDTEIHSSDSLDKYIGQSPESFFSKFFGNIETKHVLNNAISNGTVTSPDSFSTGSCPSDVFPEALGMKSVVTNSTGSMEASSNVNAGSGTEVNNALTKIYTYNGSPDYDKLMKSYLPSYAPTGQTGGFTAVERAYNWYHVLKDNFDAISVSDATGCSTTRPSNGVYLQYLKTSDSDPSKTEVQYCPMNDAVLDLKSDEIFMQHASNGKGVVNAVDATKDIIRPQTAREILNNLNSISLPALCATDSSFPLCKSTPLDCQKDPNGAGCKDINGANATENEDDKQNSEQAVCMQNAGSLGWIVCPMIYGLRDAANGIFKNTVTPLLRVHDSIVEALAGNSESSTMYQAWSFFRNIGNILFVLAMLFVIFSQITGFGIDNYGIKKILPKLIVTAIIVNFSYIICGALVDLSNIAGDGIKNIFESVATNLSGNTTPSFTDNVAGSVIDIVAFIGTGAAVAGSVATVAGAVTSGSLLAIIVPVLAFVGSAVIAGLFAMLMLGLRQALIVIMIAISPVAFVLYAIPNTSGIFKKWLQLFKTLLILYPVFCFMSGGGFLASNLIIKGTNEFYMKLIAGLISIAPFFMVPSMTKSAMKGFDGAVAGLSNLQSRVNRTGDTINRRVMNSDTMKSQAENAQLGKYRRLVERYKDTDTSKLGQWRKRQVISAFNALNKSAHQDAVLDVAKSQYRFDTDPVNKENARVSAMREIDEKNKQQIMSGYADRNMSAGEALVQLDTAQRDYKYSDHSEQENHDHDVELAALQSHLLSTKDGQKMYNSYLSGKEIDTGVVGENGNKVKIKAGATSDRAKAVLARDYVNKHSDLKDKYQISFAQMRNIQGAGPVEKMKTEVSTANSLATNRQSGVNSFAESIDLKDIDKLGNKDAEELVQANLSGSSAQNTTAAVNAIVQQAESDPSKAGTYTPEIKRLIRRYSSNHTDLDNLGSRSFVVRDASGNVQQTIRLEQNNNNNNNQSS